MKISIPELSLVILIGPSGCGKSTFARKQFLSTEVVSSDVCRALVADDENDQTATGDAFDLLHEIVRKRLSRGKLAVVDATNVQPESRKSLMELAHEYHVLPVAIVFDLSERLCQDRNTLRSDRQFGPHVVRNQIQQLRRSLRGLEREGFRYVHKLSSPDEIEAVTIERQPLWNNKRGEHGPFDIIGDVHGCLDELLELMAKLGYQVERSEKEFTVTPPDGRKLAFVGDLVDRGPATPDVLRLVMTMVRADQALCVPGNHDIKLVKALRGKNVQIAHGLAASLEQLAEESAEFRADAAKFLDGLVSHYVLDDGKLVIAHAGMKESMQGRGSGTRYNGVIIRSYTILNPGYPNPLPPGVSLSSLPTNLDELAHASHMPLSLQFSAGIEHAIQKHATLSATYRGMAGEDMFRSRDINAPLPPTYTVIPNPQSGFVRQIEFEGRQLQNALDLTLQGKISRWFSGVAQYTWSHTNNDTGGIAWYPANQYDNSGEYSRADFDQRHRFNLLGTFNEGHWANLGLAVNLYSGTPYTETSGVDTFNTGLSNARPAGVSRNTLQGGGYADLDASWSRDVYFTRNKSESDPHLTISIDSFNLPNHVNYTSYVGNIQSAFFGTPTAAQPARRFQLTAGFTF